MATTTRVLSPFASRRKGFDDSPSSNSNNNNNNTTTATSSTTNAPVIPQAINKAYGSTNQQQPQVTSPLSEADATLMQAPKATTGAKQTSTTTTTTAEAAVVNRRASRLKQSPSGNFELVASNGARPLDATSELPPAPPLASVSSATAGSAPSDVLSPGQRRVAGAFAGKSGSGVLLEG